MARVPLSELGFGRSGDKGRNTNVAIIAFDERAFEILRAHLTADVVAAHFARIAAGPVERFEVPNLRALNFVLHDSLGGGGSQTMRTDAQGKTHAAGLLLLELELDITEDRQG